MFTINPYTGIVVMNVANYLTMQHHHHQSLSLGDEKILFDLKLSVTDQVFTSYSRLHIQIKSKKHNQNKNSTNIARPKFKVTFLNLPVQRYSLNFSLDLNKELETHDDFQFFVNMDESMLKIENETFLIYKHGLIESQINFDYYHVPILACDRLETGLCDQMLVILNATTSHHHQEKHVTFAYDYWALTIQQSSPQTKTPPHQIDDEESDYLDEEDDEYYMDENFESNERFYFDIKVNDENLDEKRVKYEFDLAQCFYTKSFELKHQSQETGFIHPRQLKSMFTLNKHNGVLSSRKVINALESGMYDFDIILRPSNESMRLRLILIPPSSALLNYFKFDKEFYKFSYEKLGNVRLQTRFKSKKTTANMMPPLNSYDVTFKLISNEKYSHLFKLNKTSGKLSYDENSHIEPHITKNDLNEDMELTLYVLALVDLKTHNFTLEYMCEIQVDFKAYFNTKNATLKQSNQMFSFERTNQPLKIKEHLNMVIYRFLAFTSLLENAIIYKMNDQEHFVIDESNGELKLIKKFNQLTKLHLNVTACLNVNQCVTRSILFELILPLLDSNQNAPKFEYQTYEGTIREDALPGTVVATVHANDLDKRKCCEYFIVGGDELNEFAVSNEGKVYTRLLLDRERISSYMFTLMAFDGKFKTLSSLVVNVLDVDDERPQCPHNSLIHLNVSESIRIDTVLYNLSLLLTDEKTNFKFELIQNDYNSSTMSSLLPFSIGEHDGHLRTRASLDYEQSRVYEFFVKLTKATSHSNNKSLFGLCKFLINVVDENDNAPIFNETLYEANIVENARAHTVLMRVYARDSDSTLNGVVR